jgi:hypothetical protein
MRWLLVALCAALPAGPGCGDEGAPTDGDVRDDGQRDADGETIDVVDVADRADGVDDGPPDVPPETGDDAGPTDDGGEPAGVVVGLTTRSFTYDGVETFVLAASYYGGCATAEAVVVADLGQLAALGFNNVRIWVTWNAPSDAAAVVRGDGSLDAGALARLRFLLETARGLGMSVDVTFGYGTPGISDGGFDNYRTAMAALASELLPYRNAWFDLGNERDVGDARYLSVEQVRDLALAVRAVDPARLVTASGGGSTGEGAAASWTEMYATANLDFATPHFSRDADWAAQTESRVTVMRDLLLAAGWDRPIYLQEEARRGYSGAEWPKEDFLTAVAGARSAGAAGWCFHTDAGFDLVAGSFFDQLDDVERDLVDELAGAAGF